jgi:uncharacterized damage-inducible protein DinB
MKALSIISIQLLAQLKQLVVQLSDDAYSQPLPLLSGNTLAKHIRHVLEIYDELLKGIQSGQVNYDARQRNLLLEHNRSYTLQFMADLAAALIAVDSDKPLVLDVCLDANGQSTTVNTTLKRELTYNMEHATHHMAILQIAVKHCFPNIELDPNFGIAFSTQTFLKNVHA